MEQERPVLFHFIGPISPNVIFAPILLVVVAFEVF